MQSFVEPILQIIKPSSAVFRSIWDSELTPQEFQPIKGEGHWRQEPVILGCVRSSFSMGAI
jgi:hypothetical protein